MTSLMGLAVGWSGWGQLGHTSLIAQQTHLDFLTWQLGSKRSKRGQSLVHKHILKILLLLCWLMSHGHKQVIGPNP